MILEISARVERGDVAFLGVAATQTLEPMAPKQIDKRISDHADIELDKLHINPKVKSGYVGVYPNGKGFRAMARGTHDHPGAFYIGQFLTSEEAAWQRYLYYKRNGLPYGPYELAFQETLDETSMGFDKTNEELVHAETIRVLQSRGELATLALVPEKFKHWIGRDWLSEGLEHAHQVAKTAEEEERSRKDIERQALEVERETERLQQEGVRLREKARADREASDAKNKETLAQREAALKLVKHGRLLGSQAPSLMPMVLIGSPSSVNRLVAQPLPQIETSPPKKIIVPPCPIDPDNEETWSPTYVDDPPAGLVPIVDEE